MYFFKNLISIIDSSCLINIYRYIILIDENVFNSNFDNLSQEKLRYISSDFFNLMKQIIELWSCGIGDTTKQQQQQQQVEIH